MTKYPEGLPYPQKEGLGFTPVNPILRTELTSGRARQRKRFTSAPTVVSFTWVLNDQQAALFEAWAVQEAGADWFEMGIVTPLGKNPHVCRFTATPNGPKRFGRVHWSYSATLEIFERPLIDPGYASVVPDYILESGIFDKAINREWPESPFQTHMDAVDRAINQEWPR